jgi:hypothetical protein
MAQSVPDLSELDPDETLRTVRARERDVARLREREAGLEVECLMADAGARTVPPGVPPGLGPERTAAIGAALDRHRRLAEALAEQETARGTGTPSQREIAAGALEAWLEAPAVPEPARMKTIARAVLLVLVAAAIWGAIEIHPAILLVLAPVVVPLTLLLRSGENASWRRLGAKRRFEQTGIEPPRRWEEEAVRARLADLAEPRRRTGEAPAGEEGVALAEVTPEAVAEAQASVRARLAEAGIEALSEDAERWMAKLAAAARARAALEEVARERKEADDEAGAAREALFRYLALKGAAPPGGKADLAALEAALAEVRRS